MPEYTLAEDQAIYDEVSDGNVKKIMAEDGSRVYYLASSKPGVVCVLTLSKEEFGQLMASKNPQGQMQDWMAKANKEWQRLAGTIEGGKIEVLSEPSSSTVPNVPVEADERKFQITVPPRRKETFVKPESFTIEFMEPEDKLLATKKIRLPLAYRNENGKEEGTRVYCTLKIGKKWYEQNKGNAGNLIVEAILENLPENNDAQGRVINDIYYSSLRALKKSLRLEQSKIVQSINATIKEKAIEKSGGAVKKLNFGSEEYAGVTQELTFSVPDGKTIQLTLIFRSDWVEERSKTDKKGNCTVDREKAFADIRSELEKFLKSQGIAGKNAETVIESIKTRMETKNRDNKDIYELMEKMVEDQQFGITVSSTNDKKTMQPRKLVVT